MRFIEAYAVLNNFSEIVEVTDVELLLVAKKQKLATRTVMKLLIDLKFF